MALTLDIGESISPVLYTTCPGLWSILNFPLLLVVYCLRKTIFSPYLAIFIPIALHFCSISSRLLLFVSCFWGVAICFIRESIHLSMTKIACYQCRTITLCRLAICQPSSVVSRSTQTTMGRSSSTYHGRYDTVRPLKCPRVITCYARWLGHRCSIGGNTCGP